jgi:feruloyl esterase
MKACDAQDGVADGVLEDPRRCRFDPALLQCSAAGRPGATCLTSAQVAAVKRIYDGVDDPLTSRKISPGLERGSELLWAAFASPGRPFPIPISYHRWLVFGDSTWDWRTFDLASARDHEAWLAADRKFAPILSAVDPNLRAFRARGGKLIQYHGWNDQLITPENSIAYYESVVSLESAAGRDRTKALADVQQFYRLFMAPGMAHCGGGEGPSAFDMERALEDWVERGVAPDTVIAVRRGPNEAPERSRPLCPYPKVAVYKGAGDTNDAASFTCRDSSGSGRR